MMWRSLTFSAVRFTDYDDLNHYPSSELLGYSHSSAIADWLNHFCAKPHSFNECSLIDLSRNLNK